MNMNDAAQTSRVLQILADSRLLLTFILDKLSEHMSELRIVPTNSEAKKWVRRRESHYLMLKR